MNTQLEKSLEEANNDTILVLTDEGRERWDELKKKGFTNCTSYEMCEWNILFDMNDLDPRHRESAVLWNVLSPGRDSDLGRFLNVRDPTRRIGWVIRNLGNMIDAGYLKLEAKDMKESSQGGVNIR